MVRHRFVGILLMVLALLTVTAFAQTAKQVDINSAPEEEIVALGIDKAVAKRIIEERPYRNKTELVSRQILTREQYEKLREMLIAKQPPRPPAQ